jgi:hypothetical protein
MVWYNPGSWGFMKKAFGSGDLNGNNKGALTNFTNTVAAKSNQGADNWKDGLINATVKGGALDALSYTKKQATGGLDALSSVASKVPGVGAALSTVVEGSKQIVNAVPV